MIIRLIVIALTMLLAGNAWAWQPPKVSYSAYQVMETAEASMEGMIYVTPGKQRREMEMDGEQTVIIMRFDKKVTWTLMPSEQMYMEGALNPDDPNNPESYKVEQTPMGEETINGIPTQKSKVIMTAKDGSKMGGFWWTTKDGIVVKMDMIAKDKGSKMRMKIELSKLKVGKQPASLFEIPSGYSKMGMPGMGGSGGGGGKGFNLKDALDLFN
ncbi:MAG TPA: DUF4412 domain-containing protein [Mariprofundaceae bacterium]|nr:DUF4412 domain-containing protein [Mariprofundaceae bacterium]